MMNLFRREVTFSGLLDLQIVPMSYYNILYIQILIWDKTNLLESFRSQNGTLKA